MNEHGIKILQWGYPLLLWVLVAFFTLLACKNVVATAAWEIRPAPMHALPDILPADTLRVASTAFVSLPH
jgi:hypothetical protein